VEVGGVDITEHVTGIEMRNEEPEILDMAGSFRSAVHRLQSTFAIETTAAMTAALQRLVNGIENIPPIHTDEWQAAVLNNQLAAGVAPHRSDTHDFEQDPAEEATLCVECGMWPEHHNHSGGYSYNGCVCQECVSDPDVLG
jgi:hypothetical protein